MVTQKDLFKKCVKDVTPLKVKPLVQRQARLSFHLNGDMVEVTFSIPRNVLEKFLKNHRDDEPMPL